MFPGGHGDFRADHITEADTREVGARTEPQETGAAFSPGGRSPLLSCSHDTLLGCVSVCCLSQTVNTSTTLFSLFSHGLPVPPLSLNVFSNFCFNCLISWTNSQLKFTRERVEFAQPTLVWAEFSWVTSPPGEAVGLASLLQGRQRSGAWGGVTRHRPWSPVSTSI